MICTVDARVGCGTCQLCAGVAGGVGGSSGGAADRVNRGAHNLTGVLPWKPPGSPPKGPDHLPRALSSSISQRCEWSDWTRLLFTPELGDFFSISVATCFT